MDKNYTKCPRLFIDHELSAGKPLPLSAGQSHYLKNVLRKGAGDYIRCFNGRDGEWACAIEGLKKQGGAAMAQKQIVKQPSARDAVHLFFSPIKKQRMDFLVEKAVELGVSDLHPVLTNRTETRKIKIERIEAQIIEAAEQCERLDVPMLHPLAPLQTVTLSDEIPLYACVERVDIVDDAAQMDRAFLPLAHALQPGPAAFLIGPEGGFDDDELIWLLKNKNITPVSLGETILRAETAALACLSFYQLKT